jgi:hypothetical protein
MKIVYFEFSYPFYNYSLSFLSDDTVLRENSGFVYLSADREMRKKNKHRRIL